MISIKIKVNGEIFEARDNLSGCLEFVYSHERGVDVEPFQILVDEAGNNWVYSSHKSDLYHDHTTYVLA